MKKAELQAAAWNTVRKIHQAAQAAMDAIQMGVSLNQRLLSFSGRREQGLERLDLNDHVTGTADMLRRTLGARITVTLNCSPDPSHVGQSR